MKKIKYIAIFAVVFFCFCRNTMAQDELLTWFEAPLGVIPPMAAYKFSYYDERNVKGQDTSLRQLSHYAFGLVPLVNKDDKDIVFLGMFDMDDIGTGAFLPDTIIPLPDKLYSLSFGPACRYQFHNGWTGGIALLLGSASDKLFHSKDELSFRTDAYLKIPAKDNNAWIILVDYYTDREYLRNIPIAGGGYWYEPSEKLQALFGLPVAAIRYTPSDNFKFEATYIMVTDVHIKATYTLSPSLFIYGAFDWNNELYARAEREKSKDRLFYYEKLIYAGVKIKPFKYLSVNLYGGYSFDRSFFEGESYDESGKNSLDTENGPFAGISVSAPL